MVQKESHFPAKNDEKRPFRFQINLARLPKKPRAIRDAEDLLLNKIKSLNTSKNPLQGSCIVEGVWIGLNKLLSLFDDQHGNDFYTKYWSSDSEVLCYIYDVCSVSGSPDYSVVKNTSSKVSSVETLYGMLTSFMEHRGAERISRTKYMATCEWLVAYLNRMVKYNNLGIKYTRLKNFKADFNVSNKDFSIPICIKLVDMLVEYGMVINFTGNKLFGSSHMSMLLINPKLLELLGIDGVSYEIKTRPESLVTVVDDDLNEVHKDILDDSTIKILEDGVEILDNFVSMVNSKYITINGYEIPEYWIRRMIRDNKEENSRLFDNGTIQCKSKVIRRFIRIDEEVTVSLDFKAIHPAILLYWAGYDIQSHNPYPTFTHIKVDAKLINKFKKFYNLDKYDPVRNIVKRLLLCLINAANVAEAVGSCYFELAEDSRKRGTFRENSMKYIGLPEINLHDLASKLIAHNHMIAKYLGVGIGNKLQYKDSCIMMKCLDVLTKEDIPCLPIHDALICKVSDKARVEQVMTEAFIEVIGEGSQMNCVIEEE